MLSHNYIIHITITTNHKKESNKNGKIYDILLKVTHDINLIVFHVFLIFSGFLFKIIIGTGGLRILEHLLFKNKKYYL